MFTEIIFNTIVHFEELDNFARTMITILLLLLLLLLLWKSFHFDFSPELFAYFMYCSSVFVGFLTADLRSIMCFNGM